MKILLRPNLDKKNGLLGTKKTIEALLRFQAIPMLDDSLREVVGEVPGCVFGDFEKLVPDCDVLLPIGGDGTIMGAARYAIRFDKPIVGVNAGRIGFLTQLEVNELDRLSYLVNGEYTIECRMLLDLLIPNTPYGRLHTALNDIVIRHGDSDRIVELEVFSGDKLIVSHRADGLIFSTPTGSTAYSLSAGGPIVSPNMSVVLLTAICPHSAMYNSLILPPEFTYTVREKPNTGNHGLNVSVDGRLVGSLKEGRSVAIRRSVSSIRFIDLGLRDFYSNLNEKLRWRR